MRPTVMIMQPTLSRVATPRPWWGIRRYHGIHSTPSRWRQTPRNHGEEIAEILLKRMQEQLKEQGLPRSRWPDPSSPHRTVRMKRPVRTSADVGNVSQMHGIPAEYHPRLVLLLVVLGGASVYYVFHLEQVPATGRWRFIDMSTQEERRMGEQAFQSTLQQYHAQILPSSSPTVHQVERVASRIIRACEKLDMQRSRDAQPTQWTVHVIHDPRQKNAFVLPGGHIFVFTGILPVCQSDAGLATVMSHEIAHQLARHSAEKVAGSKVLFAAAFVLEMMGLDIGLSRILLNLVMNLPNSRKIESEADELGLRIMSQACYNPHEAVYFWYVVHSYMQATDGCG